MDAARGRTHDAAMPAKKPLREAPTTLRKWRLFRGLTLEQVGNIVGVGPQAVHKWEVGKSPVDLDILKLLAQAYGTSPEALLMEPHQGSLVERMRRAHEVLTKLPADQAEQWLGVGAVMATKDAAKEK